MQEIINFVPYFISVLFCIIVHNICYAKLNNHKLELNLKNSFVIIFTTIIVFLNNSYQNLWLKFALNLIIFCINFKLIYHDNIKKIIITYIFIFLVVDSIEIVLSNLLLKTGMLNNYEMIKINPLIKITMSAIMSTIEYIIFKMKIIDKLIKKLISIFEKNIIFLSISYIFCITYLALGILNIENFAAQGSVSLITLLSLLFFILFIITIHSKYKEDVLKVSNERLVEYNEKYGLFLDEYKIYKHNIKNKLIAIKTFGNKKVKQLIDDLLEEETTFSIKNNNLYKLPNGIKGIVAEKLYNPKIDVMIDNKIKGDPFILLRPKAFNNISEAIGICIDNAIEASIATKNPIITFDLYENKEYIYIKTGNSFCNNIDLDKLGAKYYSTKNRGSGLGLFSITRNKDIKEKITIINNFYYIELQIKKAR